MNIKSDTLYKRTSAGKIQIWFAEQQGSEFRTTSGQEDGKKVVSKWTTAVGKNVGKANETTPEEQAASEIESLYEHRLERDYWKSRDDVDRVRHFKPMLASKWQDRLKFLLKAGVSLVYIQPKLDGIRCIINSKGMFYRSGKEILSSPHIFEAVQFIFEEYPDLTLDGELYNHTFRDNFDKLTSLINKKKPTTEDLAESKEKLKFYIFDADIGKPAGFSARQACFKFIYYDNFENTDCVELVDTLLIEFDVDKVAEIASSFIEDGYEGAMIRLVDMLYLNKRSKELLKWKEFQDEEFEILDITEGEGNRAGIASRVICKLPDGQTFTAMPNGTFEYCQKLLENKEEFIGKPGTVMFQNYTPAGKPRFPKFKIVRDYE